MFKAKDFRRKIQKIKKEKDCKRWFSFQNLVGELCFLVRKGLASCN